jgi:hypothetical protein
MAHRITTKIKKNRHHFEMTASICMMEWSASTIGFREMAARSRGLIQEQIDCQELDQSLPHLSDKTVALDGMKNLVKVSFSGVYDLDSFRWFKD